MFHLTASVRAAGRATLRLLALLPLLGACDDNAPAAPPEIRPVRVVTVVPRSGGDSVSITGTVAAETEVNLAFRIDGRMVERLVNVGDRVKAGQVVARLDRQNEENGLRAARAQLTATRAQLTEARNNYQRQRELLQEFHKLSSTETQPESAGFFARVKELFDLGSKAE